MQILALGLPRSGTDSLRNALTTLGYGNILHGFDIPATRPNDYAIWTPLLLSKARGDDAPGRAFDWDVLLGDCDGVMDMPPVIFAEEILDFYPGAKVVLNRRKDMEAWHRSLNSAAETVLGSWGLWGLSWWDAKLFWCYRTLALSIGVMGEGEGGFKRNGKEWAGRYYERVRERLEGEGREYLDWEVQDGWGPLCEFLGKEVPDEEFPWSNKGGNEFEKNVDKALEKMVKRAALRIAGTVVVIAAGVGGWWWRSQ
ncbi:hypothetical protein V494_04792 [Pseudogymnoascus sp. VKM F-4513 (FW-928)]|nr:hypothetical protein V494_04792 [Pseudogymnoascus sp. VKM F-4513 (FW-928)]